MVVAAGAFVALAALTGLVRGAPHVLTWLVLGTLLALALDPLVGRAQRLVGGHRAPAVGIVLVGFLLAATAVALLLAPPAVRQARDLQRELPRVVSGLEDLPLVGERLADADVPEKVQAWIEDLPERVAGDPTPLEDVGRQLAGGLLAAVATLLVTVTLLLDGSRLVSGARRLLPARNRERAERAGRLMYRIVGRYFAGSLLVALIAGIVVLVAGLILGVPLTPLAAVWVSMTNLIPQIGGALGGIPFVLLAVTESPLTGVAAAAFFVLYLQFENHILQPLVVGEAVDLSPPATMVAALVGVSAAGVAGAIMAVPLLGTAKAIYAGVARRRDAAPV